MKQCKGCKLEKNFTEFYPNAALKDGREGKCKTCRNAKRPRVKDPKPPGRKKVAEKTCPRCKVTKPRSGFYDTTTGISWLCRPCVLDYRQTDAHDAVLLAAKRRRESEHGREYRRQYAAKFGAKYREKYKAQGKVKARSMARYHLEHKPCEVCGDKAHAHHEDYSKPLDVRWLCPKHHGEEHRKYG